MEVTRRYNEFANPKETRKQELEDLEIYIKSMRKKENPPAIWVGEDTPIPDEPEKESPNLPPPPGIVEIEDERLDLEYRCNSPYNKISRNNYPPNTDEEVEHIVKHIREQLREVSEYVIWK